MRHLPWVPIPCKAGNFALPLAFRWALHRGPCFVLSVLLSSKRSSLLPLRPRVPSLEWTKFILPLAFYLLIS